MNLHATCNLSRLEADHFQQLRNLIDTGLHTAVDVDETRRLIRSSVEGACFYETALAYGHSFQSHIELLAMAQREALQSSVDMGVLRAECHRYLGYFETACGS